MATGGKKANDCKDVLKEKIFWPGKFQEEKLMNFKSLSQKVVGNAS